VPAIVWYFLQVRFGERAVIILAAILALISGFVVLVAVIIRRSEMLVFPQVLALYKSC